VNTLAEALAKAAKQWPNMTGMAIINGTIEIHGGTRLLGIIQRSQGRYIIDSL